MSEPLTAGEALRRSAFTEYRKTALTPISDITYPPGTVYQTPEGLRAEDEDTRAAFDVQGGIYPIRESVFRASYGATPTPDTLDALDAVERSLRDAYGDVNDVWVPWTVIRAALVTREEMP